MSLGARADVVRMPMLRSFAHAQATRSLAENVVLSITLDGAEGAGECVPRPYVTGETVETVLHALARVDLDAIASELPAASLAEAARQIEALDLAARLGRDGRPGLAAACALEMALLDVSARRLGEPLRHLGAALGLAMELRQEARRHPISALLDFTRDPSTLGAEALHHVKVKLGRGRAWDIQRVEEVRRIVGPTTSLSVDANMAWSLDEACSIVRALEPLAVRWYEEPMAKGALEDYRRLREETGAKVMLDESVCSREDAERALEARACDHFNVRLSKCGGLLASLRLVEMAHAAGVGFQIGCQIGEMAVLEAAARSFAGTVGGWVSYGGAGGHQDFAEQIVREPLPIDEASATVEDLPGAGLGVTLVRETVARFSTEALAWKGGRWRGA